MKLFIENNIVNRRGFHTKDGFRGGFAYGCLETMVQKNVLKLYV